MALRAALLLASLLSTAHSTTTTACPPPTPTTYTLITPSPSAKPTPVTSQGQLITSHIPQYAICNPDRSDCTTVYSPTTYAWCSTTLPCYPHSCTVTDCAQPITFSHAASYHLASTVCTTSGTHTVFGTPTHISAAPTTLYYVEPVITRYILPYTDYVESHYDEVVVEHCTEVGPAQTVCEVSTERWVERVSLVEKIDVLPVTLHTYCEKATTVTWAAGQSVVVPHPSTVTWVTGSTRTSTLTSTVTLIAHQTMPRMEYDATVTVTTDCTESGTSTVAPTHKPTAAHQERGEFAGYEYETSGDGKADGQVHSYGQYKDHAEAYKYSTSGAGVSYKDYEKYLTAGYEPTAGYKPAMEERDESAAYEYETASAGKADGQVHSYGQYKDHAEAYEYSTSGAGVSYKDHEKYPTAGYKPVIEERDEFAGYEYETSGDAKADGQVHSYGQYKDHAEAYKYSTSGAGVSYKDHEKYPTAGYEPTAGYKPAMEERDESAAYEYETAGAGKADGQVHSYGQYKDHAEAYEYSTGGAGASYNDHAVYPTAEYKNTVEERDESAAYEYETAGAGKADGQVHSYGQYKDHAEAYEYSTGGAGASYKDNAETHEYGTGAGYSTKTGYAVEERDEFAGYEYETSGAGKAAGEKHSYGQYADYSAGYEYSTDGAGAAYSDEPIAYAPVAAEVEERDEYSHEQAGSGRKSGEVHSYGQYADYSEEYEYSQGQASSDDNDDGALNVATANASGEYSHKASGERHSYGQYQDYEMGVKHEYENEASIKASKQGENSYSYGVEKVEYDQL